MIELPDFGALRVTQGAVKPTKRDYDSIDQLTIVVPKGVTAAQLRALPQGSQLVALHARAKRRDEIVLSSRMSNSRATRVTVATLAAADAFGTLTSARKLIAHSVQENPAKVGLLAVGLADAERERALRALVAAAFAAALQDADIQERQEAAPPEAARLQVFGAPLALEDVPRRRSATTSRVGSRRCRRTS